MKMFVLRPTIATVLRHASKSVSRGDYFHRNCPIPQRQRKRVQLFGVAASTPPNEIKAPTNYFDTLGVDRSFTQSPDELKSRYKRLMTDFHPDRHALSSEEEKSQKASMATNVTHAYSVIRDPLSRALHLLELHGAAIDESDNSIVDSAFLFEIMEVREEVEHASSDKELRPLLQSCHDQQSELCQELAKSFREERIDDAKSQAAKLQYWNRIEESIMERTTEV